jgi:hypothetical protein
MDCRERRVVCPPLLRSHLEGSTHHAAQGPRHQPGTYVFAAAMTTTRIPTAIPPGSVREAAGARAQGHHRCWVSLFCLIVALLLLFFSSFSLSCDLTAARSCAWHDKELSPRCNSRVTPRGPMAVLKECDRNAYENVFAMVCIARGAAGESVGTNLLGALSRPFAICAVTRPNAHGP